VPLRRIVFVIFDGFQSLDLTGPYEVFQQANRRSGAYQCQVVARQAGLVRSAWRCG
jgi:transcriptional regulator GlxA family with amidase domain